MKSYWKIGFLVILALYMISCAQRKNTSNQLGRGRLSRGNGALSNAFLSGFGSSVQGNRGMVFDFTSNMAWPNGTPVVPSCAESDIKISVTTNASIAGGSFDANNAQLHIDFILGCQGYDYQNQPYRDIPVDMYGSDSGVTVTGSITPDSATLTFDDGDGTITLSGPIVNGTYNATVSYANRFRFVNGQPSNANPASGTLGMFSINACSIFTCN